MNERFKFYIIYPIGLHQMPIETTHKDWSSVVDSFQRNYEIEKHQIESTVSGEKHIFVQFYACAENAKFHIGWIDQLID